MTAVSELALEVDMERATRQFLLVMFGFVLALLALNAALLLLAAHWTGPLAAAA